MASTNSETGSVPPALSVAMVSPEAGPFASSGGLGDVLSMLPIVLEQLGLRVSLIVPAYRAVLQGGFPLEDTGIRFTVPISSHQEGGKILKTTVGNAITVYFIRADKYFDRDYLYNTPEGDYPDNAERFTFFSRAALEVLKLEPHHILHCHDWQSALAITFLKAQPHLYPQLSSVKTVLTVHNLGFQGLFLPQDWHLLNLEGNLFTPQYLEFYGKINFIKGGLIFADAITTVSPTYAEEIKTAEQGFGLEGIFRQRAASLTGILNGVNYNLWNPETDPLITERYSIENPSGKKICKADLQAAFSLPEDKDVPLIGMVSRLTTQKGFDLIERALEKVLSHNLQFILLGTGERKYQEFLLHAAAQHPEKLAVKIAYDESLAHKVIAGSDMFLMPSRYEPCGLTQLYSFKYGTIPVVRASGGLKDTVEEFDPKTEEGNGFVFSSYEVADFLAALDRALAIFSQEKKWQTLVKNAMTLYFSWTKSALAYLDLYRRLAGVSG